MSYLRKLTDRQINRYMKKGILDIKIKELKEENEWQERITSKARDIQLDEVYHFKNKFKYNKIVGLDTDEDFIRFIAEQKLRKELKI